MDNLLSFGEAFFAGTVPEAIETASREERVMLAYFFDDEAMEPVFREPAVAERLGTDTVAVRLPSGGDDFARFAELYGNPPELPALYFLSSQGAMLNKLMGVQPAEAVLEAAKIAGAKNKIELMRRQKEAEAKAQQEQAEIRRREEAKLLQESKRQMEERRRAMEAARAREAAEDARRHREEVVEKVRAERDERRRKEQIARGEAPSPPSSRESLSSSGSSSRPASAHGRAKIKFVVGDENLSHEFAASDTLATMRQYLRDNGHSGVTLETVFPRRVLAPEDDNRTLADLGLTPACAVIVNSGGAGGIRGVGGRVSAAFSRGSTLGAPQSRPAQEVRRAQPTIHPNVDSTYVHPNETDTFFNDIWRAGVWCIEKITGCCRRRTRPAEAQGGALGGGAGDNGSGAVRRAALARNGPYEMLDQDDINEP